MPNIDSSEAMMADCRISLPSVAPTAWLPMAVELRLREFFRQHSLDFVRRTAGRGHAQRFRAAAHPFDIGSARPFRRWASARNGFFFIQLLREKLNVVLSPPRKSTPNNFLPRVMPKPSETMTNSQVTMNSGLASP
jgi:hypothetical protein